MFESKFSKLTTVIMIVLIIGLVVGIGVMGYSIITDTVQESATAKAGGQSGAAAPGTHQGGNGGSGVVVANENAVSQGNAPQDVLNGVDPANNPVASDPNSAEDGNQTGEGNVVKKELLEGYEVVATLKIPAIKLNEKVLGEVTKKSLETALALMYTEKGINYEGNTVIIGHNYKNGLFFSNLSKVKKGDTISLKNQRGDEVKYKVTETFEAAANDSSFYKSHGSKTRTLILSTCTDDASETEMRTIVKAEEAK